MQCYCTTAPLLVPPLVVGRDKNEKGNKGTMATVADGWAVVGKNYTSAEGECHRTENQQRDKLKVAAGT